MLKRISTTILSSLLIACTTLLTIEVTHAGDRCLHRETLEQLMKEIDVRIFDSKPLDLCTGDTHAYRILEPLEFLKTVRFSSEPLPLPFNQNILPKDFWSYLVKNAKHLVESNELDQNCRGETMAYTRGDHSRTIHICPNFFDDRKLDMVGRAVVLLHETRHFKGYDHIECKQGPNQNMGLACDRSLSKKGSYAVNVEALAKASLLSDALSPLQRSLAKMQAIFYLNTHFNETPRNGNLSAIHITEESGDTSLFDGSKMFPFASAPSTRVTTEGHFLAFYPDDKSNAYNVDSFSKSQIVLPSQGTVIVYNQLSQAQRPQFIDSLSENGLTCAVFINQVSCSNDGAAQPINTSFTNSNIEAAFTASEAGQKNKDSIYLRFQDGSQSRVELLPDNTIRVTPVSLSDLSNFKTIVIFKNRRLGLNSEGAVFQNNKGQWKPYDAMKGVRVKSMTRPLPQWDSYFLR